jgi:5-(carboxyamino)imidazole ribonucleotide synthase
MSALASAPVPDCAARVGIIGGGQLGMLLCRAARRLGVQTTVLTDDAFGPAVHAADHVLVAPLDDPRALSELRERSDAITFEIEAVPDAALERLRAASASQPLAVRPGVAILARLKDKGLQKSWLAAAGLPTLPCVVTDGETTADDLLGSAIRAPLVQKARRGGYDGRGVQVLRDPAELARLWPVPSVIEPAVEGAIEVAVVVARSAAGELRAFPPVTMLFDPGLNAVSTVTSPGALAPEVTQACHEVACAAVSALGAAGVFAVELFVTAEGALYINEISPRVHNSGHLTMEAFVHDQFEQHVRAISGRPLAPVVPRAPAAVMLNLLYHPGMAAAHTGLPYTMELEGAPQAVVHWYGKREARPGRKMGHITALGDSPAEALQRAKDGLARLCRGDVRPPAIEALAS